MLKGMLLYAAGFAMALAAVLIPGNQVFYLSLPGLALVIVGTVLFFTEPLS